MIRLIRLGVVAAAWLTFTSAHAQGEQSEPPGDGSDAGDDDTSVDVTGDEAERASATPATAPATSKRPVDVAATETMSGSAGSATPGALGGGAPAGSPFSWQPFGYIRMQYIAVQNDPNVQHVGRDDGFELQNARFGIRGAYQERVRFALTVDGAVESRAQQNTPQSQLRIGLRDAYTDVVAGGRAYVRAGFFQTWSDPQRLIADTIREFVDRPIESRGVRSTEGWYADGLPPGRSIGGALRIEPRDPMQIGFELAVQNGADEFSANNDNDLPAVSASALLKLPLDGFIVAGGRYNPRTVGELPFRQDETDLQGNIGVQINTAAVRIAGAAIVQRTTFASTGGPVQNAFGAHGQLTFRIPAPTDVWVGYRFGILDPSSLIVTDRVMEHTVGGFIAVPDLRMRVQLQIVHVMEQAARELSNSRAQIAAEVAL